MQELIRKIESDAAARLPLPPGRMATQELGRYKGFLKLETHRVKMMHRAGAGGVEVCHARAVILDVLLRYLWEAALVGLEQKKLPPFALVAIGGYGRAELNPHSDIDFMFLHNKPIAANRPSPELSKLVDGMLYPLWDIGLKVGHSVRTIDEAVRIANSDMQSKTSLIESRLIVGDEGLFKKFQKALISKCVDAHEAEYIGMRVEDQAARRNKFGNSASMQEPNLKNGCGGLRDFQNLLWMAFFKYRTRSLKELQAHELVTESERKQLEAAYAFLLRVRTEMHYHVNRAMDTLTKSLQPAVAHNLGYRERSPSRRIEVFMRDLYTHLRNIFLITRTLEKRLALRPRAGGTRLPSLRGLSLPSWLPGGRRPQNEPLDGFKILDGEIHAVSPRIFREQPRRMMRVFLYAQQRGLSLHPDLAQLIRNQLGLVDRAFLADEHVRDTFLTILNQRGDVGPILRAMHEVDFLGKYLPEFGRLTCLVQHEFYHQYTADEHTLMCVEQLDRVWEAKDPPYNTYAPLLQKLERPFLLYLGLLLHDTGKPQGHGRHSQVSTELALRAAKRLHLDGAATEALRILVEHHLLMVSVSQRRDLDDPAVIRNFAKTVRTPEMVNLLTLHSFVDSQATSDKLWNGFKDSLLWQLHYKSLQLMSGRPEFGRGDEEQSALLREDVKRLLPPQLTAEEFEAHFAAVPERYCLSRSAREVVDDIILAHRFMRLQISDVENPLAPVVNWHNEPDRGGNEVKVCTWDRAGLFRKIAGSLSAAGLNILSAEIFSRADGIVLDTFFVTDASTGSPAGPQQRDEFERVLLQVLTGEELDFYALIARQKGGRPMYQAYTGERLPTRIHFDNDSSDTRTIVEVETEDRLGLLYAIAQMLTELELDISGARITTERGAAIDSFYVRDSTGGKVLVPERRQAIERKLRQAIAQLADR